MKRTLLLLIFLPFVAISQTKTTISNGNFYNPLIWDCLCFPADGDQLVINHAVVMNTDIYYTHGQITISPTGSLMEDATNRAFWINGPGILYNNGVFKVNHLLFSPGAYFANYYTGSLVSIDSLWNQSVIENVGTIEVYDFLNDETASFTNTGELNVLNDMNNQGFFINNNSVSIANDFSNCNTQTMDALLQNNGTFCVSHDFLNCVDDTLTGNGHYFIGGSSSNLGRFTGTFTFHTPSGTIGIPGSIGAGVTVTNGSCNLIVDEILNVNVEIFPNPTTDKLTVTTSDQNYSIISLSGALIQEGTIQNSIIDVKELNSGMYLLLIENEAVIRFAKE